MLDNVRFSYTPPIKIVFYTLLWTTLDFTSVFHYNLPAFPQSIKRACNCSFLLLQRENQQARGNPVFPRERRLLTLFTVKCVARRCFCSWEAEMKCHLNAIRADREPFLKELRKKKKAWLPFHTWNAFKTPFSLLFRSEANLDINILAADTPGVSAHQRRVECSTAAFPRAPSSPAKSLFDMN